jgi:hypothetical protein
MAFRTLVALTLGLGTIGFASANDPVVFKVNEPVSIAGVPPVTLGPGSYVLRTVESSSGGSVVQIMSARRDYVYTTVVTIPAVRPHAEDSPKILLSETPSGTPPALHYWFPPGETIGREFINPQAWPAFERSSAPKQLQVRADGTQDRSPAGSCALSEAMARIETGKLGAARDCFRRNYFLTRNREGAFASFVLALLMTDREEARASLEAVNRLDPERARALSRRHVNEVVESLPDARKNLKSSRVRRFLLDLAMERTDDPTARMAVLSFERHVLKGDSFPVEMALDRRREELEKERTREARWVLAQDLVARLNDCVKSLLNQVGALEYSASAEATGRYGSVRLRVVLTQRRLNDLDAIVARSRRSICQRQTKLERLIAQRNAAISRELEVLRLALRELDRAPASVTKSQFGSLRNWESASAAGVSRDLMLLAETATLPSMRPSTVFRANSGYASINIAASITRLAEWAGL